MLIGASALSACGGDSKIPTTPTPPPSSVVSVLVGGWLSPLKAGESVQLSATAVLANGANRSVTTEASWQSSNPTLAIVSPVGLVTAMAQGAVEIRATFEGRTGSLPITIEPGLDPNSPLPGLACGVERWSVKTLSDPDATRVNISTVNQTTIRALNDRTTRCSGLPSTRAFSEEFEVYEVLGRITFVRLEDDRDYHIALADPADGSYTMVTEVADIACQGAIRSPHRGVLESARNGWIALLAGRPPSSVVGMTVRVRGVGFYDFSHGQTGRSRSCIELHPITVIGPL
jgi:hypothetical protein